MTVEACPECGSDTDRAGTVNHGCGDACCDQTCVTCLREGRIR